MTGSLDTMGTRYAAMAVNQEHRVEMIQDAEEMAKALLNQFLKESQNTPERILYLRDGVSEGQYSQVIEIELSAIRKAAEAVTNSKRVKIAVIIVKKRHHTRFFPLQNAPIDEKTGNVKPGTVVDSQITHPSEFDFCTTFRHAADF
jgi:eukaryotic translation initiation factor 2C